MSLRPERHFGGVEAPADDEGEADDEDDEDERLEPSQLFEDEGQWRSRFGEELFDDEDDEEMGGGESKGHPSAGQVLVASTPPASPPPPFATLDPAPPQHKHVLVEETQLPTFSSFSAATTEQPTAVAKGRLVPPTPIKKRRREREELFAVAAAASSGKMAVAGSGEGRLGRGVAPAGGVPVEGDMNVRKRGESERTTTTSAPQLAPPAACSRSVSVVPDSQAPPSPRKPAVTVLPPSAVRMPPPPLSRVRSTTVVPETQFPDDAPISPVKTMRATKTASKPAPPLSATTASATRRTTSTGFASVTSAWSGRHATVQQSELTAFFAPAEEGGGVVSSVTSKRRAELEARAGERRRDEEERRRSLGALMGAIRSEGRERAGRAPAQGIGAARGGDEEEIQEESEEESELDRYRRAPSVVASSDDGEREEDLGVPVPPTVLHSHPLPVPAFHPNDQDRDFSGSLDPEDDEDESLPRPLGRPVEQSPTRKKVVDWSQLLTMGGTLDEDASVPTQALVSFLDKRGWKDNGEVGEEDGDEEGSPSF